MEGIFQSYSESDRQIIEKAFTLAQKAHQGQNRLTGEPYISHPLAVAQYLAGLKLDVSTIAAALLHDTIEDTLVTDEDIKKEFGPTIAFLVQGATKLKNIEYSPTNILKKSHEEHLDTLKKMLFAMAQDLRVILIKLADRLHNMETLSVHGPEDQKRIATDTLEIYAPIASRLGMGELKGQLEDLAFPYVLPTEYKWLKKKVKDRYSNVAQYIGRIKPIIERHLVNAGINVISIDTRAKRLYSLYQKLLTKDMDLSKIHDIVAMRIIVPDIKSCYEALGALHAHYKPFPGLIKDYITMPKPNGYRSLHTTIFCERGKIVEIQIRTPEMHEHNEKGIAAHWAYTEGGKRNIQAKSEDLKWINQLKDFLKDAKSSESFSDLKIDFFKNRIFVLTPKGDVEDLPEGATPIDFAYAIHTDLGHALRGARVNGKMVPIDYNLKNGDVVEIVKGKELKPSRDWLNVVKTTEARRRIRGWFLLAQKGK